MRTLLAGIILLALTASSEAATVEGTASVVDGDTLDIHGERIRLYGIDAPERADAMLEKGSLDGQRVWKRVLAAVKEIQRREPREGEAVN